MGYRKEDIERLMAELAALPAVGDEEVNKQEAVRLLARTIQTMQKKGYKIDQIAELVSQRGVTISGTTLKSYLHRVKDRPKAARARGSSPRVTSTIPPKATAKEAPGEPVRSTAVAAPPTASAGQADSGGSAMANPRSPGAFMAPAIPKQLTVQRTVDPKKVGFAPRNDSDDI